MNRVEVLDHGYIELVETWGSDERIVEAARMSTAKGFLGWGEEPCSECGGNGTGADRIDGPGDVYQAKCDRCDGKGRTVGDEKLLRFLWRNAHATPFEMAGAIFEVQGPIMVFREWHRHRTQSYNELSARYTPLPAVDYLPAIDRVMLNAGGSNKQAGTIAGAEPLTEPAGQDWLNAVSDFYTTAEDLYQHGLRAGVPKELARLVVPVGRYSRMRASANLRNWLSFVTLRSAPNAQWEIRQFSNALAEMLCQVFPRTMAIFNEGRQS
jgi:thymidylate synthase (FAD)